MKFCFSLYWFVMPVVSILLPINIPVEYFGESVLVSIFIAGFLRIALSLHYAWLINSAIILWGLDPVNRYIIVIVSIKTYSMLVF